MTEFIPISSSGHLVIVPEVLGWPSPGLSFDVLLHVASLIALAAYFYRDLMGVARGVLVRDRDSLRLLALLVIGTIPAVMAGAGLSDYFEGAFTDARSAAIQLVITAAILIAGEQALSWHQRRAALRPLKGMAEINPLDAGVIGIAQAISILPGISRSGATISAGLALRVARDDSARFGFLLAVPALFGAALVQVPDLGQTPLGVGAGVAGFLASLLSSYIAIAGLIRYLRSRTLYPFAVYCVVAGLIFLLIL
ncbi:MAG: undecaprenyl-diphosphate phosphatase [Actinomycetota bacterium]|nr:undecaprenyl-diphosphate phosphatase [Actinomycetota bacterium]